jgi:hypothetical protein
MFSKAEQGLIFVDFYLFNDAATNSDYRDLNDLIKVNNELEWICQEMPMM